MEAHYVKFLIDKVCEEEIRRENLMKKLATLKNPPSNMKEVQLNAYQAQIDEPYNKTLMTDESIIFRGRELTIPRSRSYIYSLLLDSSSYPKELKDLYNSGTSFDDANIYVYLGTVGEINSKGKLVNQAVELTQSNSNLFS